jgi:hypothetical protein
MSEQENKLLSTIRLALTEVHIETGRRDDFDRVCLELEEAISKEVWRHEIDFYSECYKPWNQA